MKNNIIKKLAAVFVTAAMIGSRNVFRVTFS